MADPAADAAERICAKYNWDNMMLEAAEMAAREVLKPLREIHRKVPKRNGWDGHWSDACIECAVLWPSPTDRLIYSSEELEGK